MTGNYYTTGQHTVVQRIGFYKTIILFPGLLVLGGYGGSNTTRSVEYWSSEVKCSLPDLSRDMNFGPSVNFIQDTVVACYDGSCDKLQDGAWVKLVPSQSLPFRGESCFPGSSTLVAALQNWLVALLQHHF